MTEVNDLVFVKQNLFLVDQAGDLLVGKTFEIPLFAVGVMEEAFLRHLFYLSEGLVEEGDRLILFGVMEDDVTAFHFLQAGDAFQKFLLTVARNTCDAQDLAAVCGKRNVVHGIDAVAVFNRHMLDDQAGFGVHGVPAVNVEI